MSRNKEIKAMVVTMCDELRSKTIKNCKGCCAKVYCRLEKYANLLYNAGYRKQVTPNPKTNFDKIKAMSVDEMVDFIFTETDHCDLCSRKNCPTCKDIEGGCKKYIKEYLESEVPKDE